MPSVYEITQEKILEALAKGVVPWVRPWKTLLPFNAKTNRNYHGINALLLNLSGKGPGFLTANQITELGGNFKGAHSEIVTFFAPVPVSKAKVARGEADKDDKVLILRYYRVFPVNEVHDLPERIYAKCKVEVADHQPVEEGEAIVRAFLERHPNMKVNRTGTRACYYPSTDSIDIPPLNSFVSVEEYYCTLFHEFAHATEHKERCACKDCYAENELRAEIAGCVLAAHIGLDAMKIVQNVAAYCNGWASKIKGEKVSLIVTASSKAYKAVDYILGVSADAEAVVEEAA